MASASLYLVTEANPAAAERLAAVLATHALPSMLIEPSGGGPLAADAVAPLVEIAQQYGTAALLSEDVETARKVAADGVHLVAGGDLEQRYAQARDRLGDQVIVGCSVGKSRHSAMLLGERGADYIGFGAPPELRDQAGAVKRRLELVTWWADLFEIPCVAFDVAGVRDAQDLVAAGTDFVTCRLGPGSSVSEALETVAAFTNTLSDPLWEARP